MISLPKGLAIVAGVLLVLAWQMSLAPGQKVSNEPLGEALIFRSNLLERQSFRANPSKDTKREWSVHIFHHPVPSWGYFERQPQPFIRYSESLFPGLQQHLRPLPPYYGPPVVTYYYNWYRTYNYYPSYNYSVPYPYW
ncbi:MAG: hypothetical protein ACUVX8_17735 [Candidatus Zipacnadales bacterium]